MANYRRTATGNWSTLAQWQDDSTGSYVNSTVLPGPNDVVYANNFIVTLDINIVVSELRNGVSTNISAGGRFDFGAGNSVTANVFGAVSNVGCIQNPVTTSTKNIIGNCTGGSSGNAIAVYCTTIGSETVITGNATCGSSAGGSGVRCDAGTVIINGNAIASTAGQGAYVRSISGANLIINGSAIGSSTTSAAGAVSEFSTSNLIVHTAVAQTGPGIFISSAGQVIVKNVVMSSTGVFGVTGGNFRFSDTGPNTITVLRQNGTTQTLVDSSIGNPATTDVRQGVTYASGALTGTLIVPPSSSVAVGVPVDNTTGTAILSVTDMGALLTSFKIS